MKNKAQVVVIGGGVVGAGTLYHLAKKGWNDVVLLERKDLTSGSTWHAAGFVTTVQYELFSWENCTNIQLIFIMNLEEETGMNVGFSVVSNIRLANCQDRMDEYKYYAGVGSTVGVNVKFLSPDEIKEVWPLCNIEGLVGAIQHPDDGYIQPADLTQALCKGARNRGAEIYENTQGHLDWNNRKISSWIVKTDQWRYCL